MKKSATSSKAVQRVIKPSERIQAPKLSHIVVERLRRQIADGELNAGDTLPSETELLHQFGISRPTLREALRVLESETLIRLGRGARSGATVLGPSVDAAARHSIMYLASHGTTLTDIHQARMLIEPPLAGMLARRVKKEHVRALQRYVTLHQEALQRKDYQAVLAAASEFHSTLGQLSENHVLSLLLGILKGMVSNIFPRISASGNSPERQAVRRRMEQSVVAHAKVLDLIARNKPADAEKFWRGYMQDTAVFLTKSGLGKLRVELHDSP
ncbi:FadR/GntR family transcriptional regulator [Povalibacter sp.]|uniref:FadR/GntR family transcriptional regulator n=1 Tax=Povalibacter sp. TaxID=1962978 RepID=UPI002F423A94